jgi:hypothetical protein
MLLLAGLLALAVSATAARCVENTAVRTDSNGYTHVYGEMFNDTDVQGVDITVNARLLDAQGNVIGEKSGPICPPDLAPHGQSMFDIRLDNPNIPAPASFDVRPISGTTLAKPLPDSKVPTLKTYARRLGADVGVAFSLRNQSATPYQNVFGCAAFYDQKGKVISATESLVFEVDDKGNIVGLAVLHPDHPELVAFVAEKVPAEVVLARAWLWIAGPDFAGPHYQPIMTTPITIQAQ